MDNAVVITVGVLGLIVSPLTNGVIEDLATEIHKKIHNKDE